MVVGFKCLLGTRMQCFVCHCSSCQCGCNKDTTTQDSDALKLRDELDDKESRIQQ